TRVVGRDSGALIGVGAGGAVGNVRARGAATQAGREIVRVAGRSGCGCPRPDSPVRDPVVGIVGARGHIPVTVCFLDRVAVGVVFVGRGMLGGVGDAELLAIG